MSASITHLWKPSTARYVQVGGFVPSPRGPQVPPPQPLAWPVKDPGDVLDYVFDIAPAVAANPGDTISGLNVTISPDNPGDLTLESSSVDGHRAVLWLAGGQASTNYTVTIAVTTAGGRSLSRSVALPVAALSSVPVPVSALTTPSGQALTEPDGTPLTLS